MFDMYSPPPPSQVPQPLLLVKLIVTSRLGNLTTPYTPPPSLPPSLFWGTLDDGAAIIQADALAGCQKCFTHCWYREDRCEQGYSLARWPPRLFYLKVKVKVILLHVTFTFTFTYCLYRDQTLLKIAYLMLSLILSIICDRSVRPTSTPCDPKSRSLLLLFYFSNIFPSLDVHTFSELSEFLGIFR